jgi:hypothetical protein
MLTLKQKRSVLLSFPELSETQISNDRYNYEVRFETSGKSIVAREFSHTGNGYVLGTNESQHLIDARGWINVKELSEAELRLVIRHAINHLRPAALRRQIDTFLNDAGLLPFSMWHRLDIYHQAPSDPAEENAVQQMVYREVNDANGLYVYSTHAGQVLYVGKGKPLKNRLWSHYLESFQTVKGDTKDNRWHRFFSSHQGELIVHWIELEDESNRKLTEQMLTMQLTPAFLSFK